jgi:hypothetical protein
MTCESCNTEIPAAFEHAVANNMCPKCGSKIMSAEKMEAFLHLRKDLSNIQMSMDPSETVDRIVTHLVSNYLIRPLSIPSHVPEKVNEEQVREQIYHEEMARREADGVELDDDLPDDIAEKIEMLKKKAEAGRKFVNAGPKTNKKIVRVGDREI